MNQATEEERKVYPAILLKWAVFKPELYRAYREYCTNSLKPRQQAEADKRLLEMAAGADVDATRLCYELFEGWKSKE